MRRPLRHNRIAAIPDRMTPTQQRKRQQKMILRTGLRLRRQGVPLREMTEHRTFLRALHRAGATAIRLRGHPG